MPPTYAHDWQLSPHTSPSGKVLYHCPVCGLYDPAPVKTRFEHRPCTPDRYQRSFEVKGGKVYVVLRGLEDAIELDKSSAKSEDQ